MNYKRMLIAKIAERLHSFGFTVYLSADKMHGFYTDGAQCVSFGEQFGMVNFSGNYRATTADGGRSVGTGWGFPDGRELSDITEEKARAFVQAGPAHWATRGVPVKMTTPEQYLNTYGKSSGFEQYTPPPLKTYKATFTGCTRGAIGITYGIQATVRAPDEDFALLELYKDYDRISTARFEEVAE